MTDFAQMLSPGRINQMILRNRVVLPGMDMNHCEDGMMTPAEISHYAARAHGGAALIITGASAIAWPVGAASWREAGLGDERFLPGLTRLADAVHAGGAKLGVQLVHHGKVAGVDAASGRAQFVPSIPTGRMDMGALADSPMDELMKLGTSTQGKQATYRVMTGDDIAWTLEMFAAAADRVKRAGADAVEIHGAHGYLINTFLSSATNERDDEYGGPLENRSRFLVEVIHAVRNAVGATFPILLRLNGIEYGASNSITPDETAATAKIAEAAGVDAIHVSGYALNPFKDFTLGPLPATVGQYREMAALVKRSVDIPVIAVGRLLPELAEEMLTNGECDFVSMGRQQLADPELVNKIAAGRRTSVRPCINCYVCVEQNFFDASAVCAVNPTLSHESDPAYDNDSIVATTNPRHIVVIGGGPGGMESARRAAAAGHRVTLVERKGALGGSTWFAAVSGSPNQMLVAWFTHEIDAADIDVRLDFEATVGNIAALDPDVVIVATGARGHDELRESVVGHTLAHDVTIIGGDLIGLSLTDHLAGHGHSVTLLEPGPHLGVAMAMPRRWTAVASATANGATLVRNAERTESGSTGDVIVTNAIQPDETLANELRTAGFDVHVVGDAGGIGYIQGAIRAARDVIAAL